MTILIKNGRLINPSEKLDKVMDIFVEDGIIKEKAESIEKQADTVIDATGCYVMPGFIDLHVHLRDPGLTQKETLSTGGMAKKILKQEARLLQKADLQLFAVCLTLNR